MKSFHLIRRNYKFGFYWRKTKCAKLRFYYRALYWCFSKKHIDGAAINYIGIAWTVMNVIKKKSTVFFQAVTAHFFWVSRGNISR